MLGELEQKIMKIIWSADRPLKPAEVLASMDCDLAYTTVMTVMKRLVDKGILKRQKKGKVYLYAFAEPQQQYAQKNLGSLFHNLVETYGNIAISEFVDTIKENPKDLEQLRDYLRNNK